MTDTKVQTAAISTEKGKLSISKSVPVPHPKDDQVLVKVAAASINPIDWKLLAYNFFGLPFPYVLGMDFSGTVAEVGKDVKDVKVGDEVFTAANIGKSGGSFAEYVVIDAVRVAHKGSKVTHAQAAALPVAFLSAWDGFSEVKVESKQTILVPGGAGGVGHFIVQLAKIHGLTVIATGGNDDSIKLLKELKADHVLNYKTDDIVPAVLKLTDGKGVDLVYDATYVPTSFEKSAKAVKEGGHVVVLGDIPKEGTDAHKAGEAKKVQWVKADLGRWAFPPTVTNDQIKTHITDALHAAVKYIEEGKLTPNIHQTISLSQLPDALADGAKGKTVPGKIIVDVTKH